jgi:hypothetical protein
MKLFKSCAAILLLTISCAHAQEDTDLNALQLANQTPTTIEAPSNWHIFTEASAGGSTLRSSNSFQPNQRLSFDLHYDNQFAPSWRVVFSDRVDMSWPAVPSMSNAINTIKEAYLSWQAQPDLLFDVGRINERNGVAFGYNPTDYFKTNAVRSVVSIDPKSLKENRQGSVMLRVQKLSDASSLSVLYSPKFTNFTNVTAGFNPNIAATNNENRWLISYSKKITEGFNPQFLAFKSEQLPIQFGLNLTGLINDATVVFLEWSGGRSPSLLTQALRQQGTPYVDDTAFRSRFASGITYTTKNKISLTAEFEYNGAGQNQASWDALQRGSPLVYGVYRNFLLGAQEPPTRRSVFLYETWQDVGINAGINHLDVSAMQRIGLVDSSRLSWLELRYRLPNSEWAVQWQRYSGSSLSEFGATEQTHTWALIGRYYF